MKQLKTTLNDLAANAAESQPQKWIHLQTLMEKRARKGKRNVIVNAEYLDEFCLARLSSEDIAYVETDFDNLWFISWE